MVHQDRNGDHFFIEKVTPCSVLNVMNGRFKIVFAFMRLI